MRIICAWCRTAMGEREGDPEATSHSICPECREFITQRPQEGLQGVLDAMDVPVIAVDADGRAVTANRKAQALLDRPLEEIRGRLGGDIIECAQARLPGGCGRSAHCSGCTIRLSVMHTFETGESLTAVTADQEIGRPGRSRQVRFIISTTRVGGTVMLCIESAVPYPTAAGEDDPPA